LSGSPAGNSSDKTRSTSHNLSRDELFDRIHPHLAVHLVPPGAVILGREDELEEVVGQGAEVDWIDTSSEWW
jgi:hypothetical protein